MCRPATAQPFFCVFRGSSQPPLPGLSVFIRGFPAVTSRSRSAGGPPAPGVLRPETVGGAEAFGSPFSDHFARRPKRSRSWLGRGERAGRPRSDGMVTAQCQRLFPSSRAGSTPGGGCAPHSAAAFGLEKISTERHFLLAFGSAKKAQRTTQMERLGKFQSSRRPVLLAREPEPFPRSDRAPLRPQKPFRNPHPLRCALADRLRPHLRAQVAPGDRCTLHIRPVAPWRAVGAVIFAPICHGGPSSPPSPRRCGPANGRGPRQRTVAPPKTVASILFLP